MDEENTQTSLGFDSCKHSQLVFLASTRLGSRSGGVGDATIEMPASHYIAPRQCAVLPVGQLALRWRPRRIHLTTGLGRIFRYNGRTQRLSYHRGSKTGFDPV